jgi:hypothetical protein
LQPERRVRIALLAAMSQRREPVAHAAREAVVVPGQAVAATESP